MRCSVLFDRVVSNRDIRRNVFEQAWHWCGCGTRRGEVTQRVSDHRVGFPARPRRRSGSPINVRHHYTTGYLGIHSTPLALLLGYSYLSQNAGRFKPLVIVGYSYGRYVFYNLGSSIWDDSGQHPIQRLPMKHALLIWNYPSLKLLSNTFTFPKCKIILLTIRNMPWSWLALNSLSSP
jgi:hypothetical protein